MLNYTLKGFSTPPGIDSKEKVRALQLRLNVKADGVWGPKTEAAWQTQTMGPRNFKSAIPNTTISQTGIAASSSERLRDIIDHSNIGETQKQRAKLSIDHLDNQKQDTLLLDVMLDGVESYFSKEAWKQGAYELMTGDNSMKLFSDLVKPGEGIARQLLNMDAHGDSGPRMDYNGINYRFAPTSSKLSLVGDSANEYSKATLGPVGIGMYGIKEFEQSLEQIFDSEEYWENQPEEEFKYIRKERWLFLKYPIAGAQAYLASTLATSQTRHRYGTRKDGTIANAFQHAYWNALMTLNIGEESAKMFADAHEVMPKRKHSEVRYGFTETEHIEMDFFFNELGRKVAISLQKEYPSIRRPNGTIAFMIPNEVLMERIEEEIMNHFDKVLVKELE